MKCRARAARRIEPKWMAAALAALYGVALPAYAGALPDGGRFIVGSGSIAQTGTSLTVSQNTTRGVIDWNGFSIAGGNRVTFDNGNGATLNRVTGGTTSSILGTLSATGSVYLINPQGIVVGAGGVVSTGGRFVASTLDVDNAAFMNGGALTFTGSSTRRVVNLGKIGSTNGDVFLISADEIDNSGSVSAPNGTVEIAAGRKVLLQDSSTGQQVFVQTGGGGVIENAGPISAAQVSLQAADGNIFALAGDHTTIRATGTATRDGHVWLVADTGAVRLGGTVEAVDADGRGGTVDTSATLWQLGSQGITPLVKAGTWNLTTPYIRVDGTIAAALNRSLNAGTSIDVGTTGADIEVASGLNWQGAASLALNAHGLVYIDPNTTIENQGSGSLTLRADAAAIDNGGSVINDGSVDWSKSTGIVSALYDLNGTYTPGTLLGNSAWTAPAFSGLQTQITAYKLLDSVADINSTGQSNAAVSDNENFALGKDIDAGGANVAFGWLVGESSPYDDFFNGQFDGMGHTLSNAVLPMTGLFLGVGTQGVVRNLNVTNASNNGDSITNQTGGDAVLTGENRGLIVDTFTSGQAGAANLTALSLEVGGLVGTNRGTIERSGSAADVQSDSLAGGLVGMNYGHIAQTYATGSVDGTQQHYLADVGGLVGMNDGGDIEQSFATGKLVYVNNDGAMVGGIVAKTNGGTVGSDVYWNTQTTGQTLGGPGISGSNGLTTEQMSNPASFAGWDFSPGGAWAMPSGAAHPVLRWQVRPPANTSSGAAL